MGFLTSNARPNQFMLVVGENSADEIQKYCYYYATKLRKKCWYLCIESTPMFNVLSMLSLASGVPRQDILSLKVAPPHFGALNDGAAELCEAECRFSQSPPIDLAAIVALAKTLSKQEGAEVLFIDALHRVQFEHGRASSPAEQRWISQALRAVAHAGELTVVAGLIRPGDQFPDLDCDSVYYCEPSEKRETIKPIFGNKTCS